MSKLEEQFGKLLRHHRKQAGLSQAQLAERIDRQTNAIQRLESGDAAPTFETLIRLADALDVDVRDFFGVGEFSARANRDDPLAGVFRLLVGMSDADLIKVADLVNAGLKFRK